MTLFEAFVKSQIVVDFSEGVSYGHEQADVFYPTVFPTVDFVLASTLILHNIADRVRAENGVDFEKMEGGGGWYTFRVGVNGFTKSKLDTCIEFTVSDTPSFDENHVYFIPLSEEEQYVIFNVIDEQCRASLGKSCDDLLAEAREEMFKEPSQ